MSFLEDGIIEKYRRIIARNLSQQEQITEDLYVPEWDDEDEERQMFREYWEFMVADGGGDVCQRLLEAYS